MRTWCTATGSSSIRRRGWCATTFGSSRRTTPRATPISIRSQEAAIAGARTLRAAPDLPTPPRADALRTAHGRCTPVTYCAPAQPCVKSTCGRIQGEFRRERHRVPWHALAFAAMPGCERPSNRSSKSPEYKGLGEFPKTTEINLRRRGDAARPHGAARRVRGAMGGWRAAWVARRHRLALTCSGQPAHASAGRWRGG